MPVFPVPDDAAWHALRDQNVGGSEIASLFYRWRHPDGTDAVYHLYQEVPQGSILMGCLSSHTTGYRLWQQKAGKLRPNNLDEVERVQAGTFLEPAIANWAAQKWDWKLRKVRRYYVHDQHPGWGVSLDYEVHEAGMPPVELKNVDALVFKDQWVAEGDEIVMPPLPYVLQLQHQIGARGADHGWVVCCVGGNKLVRGRIERHEPTLAKIGEAVDAFWNGVRSNTPPRWVADYETVSEEFRFGGGEGPVDLTDDGELGDLCERYKQAKPAFDQMTTYLDNLKAQIAARLGEAPKAKAPGFNISWPVIRREEKLIPERIQPALTYRGGLTISIPKEKA